MSNFLNKTLRTLGKPRKSNLEDNQEEDRNVWSEPVESGEFELVSTLRLEKILASDDGSAKLEIANAAANDVEGAGILAQHKESDNFEIVDADGGDELSLVTTQMLKRILRDGEDAELTPDLADTDSGFNPYNSS